MRQFKEFKSEQQYVTEIGPIAATLAGLAGLVGGYAAAKKFKGKFKSYRESQAEKKANRDNGVDIEIKKIDPETGEEYTELMPLRGREANLDAEGIAKRTKEEQTKYNNGQKGRDKKLAREKQQAALQKAGVMKPGAPMTKDLERKGIELLKKERDGDSEDDSSANTASTTTSEPEDQRPRDKEGNLKDKKDAQDEFEKSGFKRAPDGWTKDPDNEKEVITKAEAEKKADKNKDSKGFVKTSTGSRKVYNSRVLKFGEFITEDVMRDLKKISKSKKDMEIKLGDGSEIPIDPMTAEIFVKYIEGLKSSEQKKVINQIQRTERGFMKVLGKAHGE